jgi:hypothetical protein
MNARGQYGKQPSLPYLPYGHEAYVGASTVKTFATGALAGGALVVVAGLMLRHAVVTQRERVAGINRYRPGLAT